MWYCMLKYENITGIIFFSACEHVGDRRSFAIVCIQNKTRIVDCLRKLYCMWEWDRVRWPTKQKKTKTKENKTKIPRPRCRALNLCEAQDEEHWMPTDSGIRCGSSVPFRRWQLKLLLQHKSQFASISRIDKHTHQLVLPFGCLLHCNCCWCCWHACPNRGITTITKHNLGRCILCSSRFSPPVKWTNESNVDGDT